MRFDEVGSQPCSIARAAVEVGDGWTLLMVRAAFHGCTRFAEFVENTGAQKTIVSDRLKKLVVAGIMAAGDGRYRLTEKGRDLAPVLIAIAMWGDRWHDDGAGVPVDYIHTDCGHSGHPIQACRRCGGEMQAGNVRLAPGPGFPADGPDWFGDRRAGRGD